MDKPPLTPSTAKWTEKLRYEIPPLQIRSINALLGKLPMDIAMIYDRDQRERMALHLKEMQAHFREQQNTANTHDDYFAMFKLVAETLGIPAPSRPAQRMAIDLFGNTPKYAFDQAVTDVLRTYKWKRFPTPADFLSAAQPHIDTLRAMERLPAAQLSKLKMAEDIAK
jgi:hypothetical protein